MKGWVMKNAIWIGVAIVAGVLILSNRGRAADIDHSAWMTDFPAAQEQSKKLNRPMLIDFSGSDWCGWCVKLDKEVFSQDVFKEYAKDNLVLFMADFPRRTQLPEGIAQQNEMLAEKYKIRGFPTVILLDPDGKVIGTTGYQRGGPEAYISHLKTFMK